MMPRTAAKITHDEVSRMVKAVRSQGLTIAKVCFDGGRLEIVIDNGDSGETSRNHLYYIADADNPKRTPRL